MLNNNFRHPKEHTNLWVCSWRYPPRDAIFQVVISAKDKGEALEALKAYAVIMGLGDAEFDYLVENMDTLLERGLVAWSGKVTVEPARLSARVTHFEHGGRWDGTDRPPVDKPGGLPPEEAGEEVLDEELEEEVDAETKDYIASLETV